MRERHLERLSHVLHEIAATTGSDAAALAAGAIPLPSAEEQMGLALRPGARVYDHVTGQEGVISAGGKANYIVPSPDR